MTINPALTFSLYNIRMYFVYVLENENNELYFGSTNDLKRRLKEHQTKQVFSTKVGTWELIYYEAYKAEEDACRRESRIKDHGVAKRQLRGRIEKSRQARSQCWMNISIQENYKILVYTKPLNEISQWY